MLMNPFLNPMLHFNHHHHHHPLITQETALEIDQPTSIIKSEAIIINTSTIAPTISNILNDKKSNHIEPPAAEVMCNLCTKLFYTEEFLAMHKLNKHGVPLSNTNDIFNQNTILKSIKNEPQQQQQSSNNNDKENLDDLTNHNILLDNNDNNKQAIPPAESYCEFCNKSFCNKYFLKTHMLRSHGKLINNRDYELDDNEYLISQHQSLEQQQHQQKSNHDSDSNDQLNDSSFMVDTNFAAKIADRVVCDICNKQVCNKYFLKTHKQKVHGIQMSDSKINDFYENNNNNNNNSCSSETSLKVEYSNALKIEINNNNNNNGNGEQFEQQSDGDNNNNNSLLISKLKQSSNSTLTNSTVSPQSTVLQISSSQQQIISRDSYCELCKRQFCSKYFLRNHMINMHGINQTKFNYNKTTPTPTTTTVLPPNHKPAEQNSSPLSSVSSKLSCNNNNSNNNVTETIVNGLASRVQCVICSKELCNKYFLRQHLINVHKTSVEDYNEKFDIISTKSLDEEDLESQKMKLQSNHLKFLSLISGNKSFKRRKRQYSECSSVSSSSSSSISAYSVGDLSSSSSSSCSSTMSLKTRRLFKRQNKVFVEKKKKEIDADGDVDMQQFLLESSDDVFCSNFMPCMVYLPVKYKLNESVSVNLTLKPIKKQKYISSNNNDDKIGCNNNNFELDEINNNKKYKKKLMRLDDNNLNEQNQIEIM
jgi:hypothetical protein